MGIRDECHGFFTSRYFRINCMRLFGLAYNWRAVPTSDINTTFALALAVWILNDFLLD